MEGRLYHTSISISVYSHDSLFLTHVVFVWETLCGQFVSMFGGWSYVCIIPKRGRFESSFLVDLGEALTCCWIVVQMIALVPTSAGDV